MNVEAYRVRIVDLLSFSAPVLAVSVLQSLTASINIVYISFLLGPVALAASANANIVIFLLAGVLSGLANAVMLQAGRAVGAGQQEIIRALIAETFFVYAGIAGVLAFSVAWFAPEIVDIIAVPGESRTMAVRYMRVMSLALCPLLAFSFLMMLMRGLGETRTSMRWFGVCVLVDFALTPIFILGAPGIPAMGMEGAAWSALLAQGAAVIGMSIQLWRRPGLPDGDGLRRSRPRGRYAAQMLAEGAPLCMQILLGSVYSLVLIAFVNGYGTSATAAYALVSQLWSYMQMPAMALASGTSALAAQRLGCGDRDEVWGLTVASVGCNLMITGVMIVFGLFLVDPLFGALLPDDATAHTIGVALNGRFSGFILLFSSSVVLFGVLRANKVYLVPLVTFSVTQYAVCIPFILLTREVLGMTSIWLTFPIGYLIPLVVAVAYFRRGMSQQSLTLVRSN